MSVGFVRRSRQGVVAEMFGHGRHRRHRGQMETREETQSGVGHVASSIAAASGPVSIRDRQHSIIARQSIVCKRSRTKNVKKKL